MQPPARHCAPCAAPCSRPCVPIPPCRSAYVVSMTLDCPLSRLESRRAMRARDDSGKLRGLRRVKEKTMARVVVHSLEGLAGKAGQEIVVSHRLGGTPKPNAQVPNATGDHPE